MEDETRSGWTGSPAHVGDDANGGNGVATGDEVDNPDEAKGGNEASRESAPSATGSAELAHDPAPAPAEARDLAAAATGEPRVDAALRLLERLPGLPVTEHPLLFEQVHAQLSEVLGELDSGPGAGPADR